MNTRPYLRAASRWALALAAVSTAAPAALAWRPIQWFDVSRYDIPPRVYGYKLDFDSPGYYGGYRYKEVYNYGWGFGPVANFPDSLPNYQGNWLPYRYWPYPSFGLPKVYRPEPLGPTVPTASVVVNVPPDAEVWMEGQKCTQDGPTRLFVSPPLNPNQTYAYKVEAKWKEGAGFRWQQQDVTVRPGHQAVVHFPARYDEPAAPAQTHAVAAPALVPPPAVPVLD